MLEFFRLFKPDDPFRRSSKNQRGHAPLAPHYLSWPHHRLRLANGTIAFGNKCSQRQFRKSTASDSSTRQHSTMINLEFWRPVSRSNLKFTMGAPIYYSLLAKKLFGHAIKVPVTSFCRSALISKRLYLNFRGYKRNPKGMDPFEGEIVPAFSKRAREGPEHDRYQPAAYDECRSWRVDPRCRRLKKRMKDEFVLSSLSFATPRGVWQLG